MATVPRVTGPSQTLQPLPGVRQNIALPAAAFDGGATDLGQAGKALSTAADQADKIAMRIAERDTADQVLAQDTALGDGILIFQQEMNKRKGVNAKGVHAEAEQWLNKSIAEASSKLNPAAKQLFLQRAQGQRRSLLDYAGRYEMQERDKAADELTAANTDLAINQAAADPTPEKVTAAIGKLTQNYKALGVSHGQEPEVVQANIAGSVAKLHAQVITGLAVNDPTQARSYFEEHKGELQGADVARLDKLTSTSVWQVQAQGLAAQVLSGQISEQAALAQIRAKYQGDQEDIFVSAIRSAGSEVDSNIAKAQRDNRLEAKNWIAQGGTLANMPPAIAANLDAYDTVNIRAYQDMVAKQGEPKTDPALYDTLSRMTPSELLARQSSGQLLQDAQHLSGSDWQYFENKASGTLSADAVKDMPTTDQLLDGAHAQLGLIGEANAARRGQFDMAARDAIAQASKAKDGAPLTYDEKKKVLDGVIKGGGASNLWKPAAPDSLTQEQQLKQWRASVDLGKSDEANNEKWAPLESMATQGIRALELAQGRPATQEERDSIWQRMTRDVKVPGTLYGTNSTKLYALEVPPEDRQQIIDALRNRKTNPIANPTELQIRELYAASIEKAQAGGDQ